MNAIRDLFRFFKDAWAELKLVSWLSRSQMIASTWLVILFVIIFSIYVGVLDFLVAKTFAFFI